MHLTLFRKCGSVCHTDTVLALREGWFRQKDISNHDNALHVPLQLALTLVTDLVVTGRPLF